MKKLSILNLLFIVLLVASCSKDDGVAVSSPTLTLDKTAYETSFFTAGQTSTPQIEWNGDKGTFTLNKQIEGVTIDQNTGVVSWGKSLPVGDNAIEIIAINSAGTVSKAITIKNNFEGIFKGGYNKDVNSTVLTRDISYEIKSDGTIISTEGVTNPTTNGTWKLNGNQLKTTFPYVEDTLILTNTGTKATLIGTWKGPDSTVGYMELTYE